MFNTNCDYVKECQQLFDHQSDEYYIKRNLHDGLKRICWLARLAYFCIFLCDYKYIYYQSIDYWLDFYLECVQNSSDSSVKKFPFEDDIVDEWFLQKCYDKQVYMKNTRFDTKITSIAGDANFLLRKQANSVTKVHVLC